MENIVATILSAQNSGAVVEHAFFGLMVLSGWLAIVRAIERRRRQRAAAVKALELSFWECAMAGFVWSSTACILGILIEGLNIVLGDGRVFWPTMGALAALAPFWILLSVEAWKGLTKHVADVVASALKSDGEANAA